MASTKVKKRWLVSAVSSFLFAGIMIGIGIFIKILIPIFRDLSETNPRAYRHLIGLTDMAWIMIVAGIVLIIVGSFELNHAIKSKRNS